MKTSIKTLNVKRLNLRLTKAEATALTGLLDCVSNDRDVDHALRVVIQLAIAEFIS